MRDFSFAGNALQRAFNMSRTLSMVILAQTEISQPGPFYLYP